MSEPVPPSPDRYDLSEAALKELYLERDDEDVRFAELIAESDEPAKDGLEKLSAVRPDFAGPSAPAIAPFHAPQREQAHPRGGKATGQTKRGGKLAAAIVALGALLALGWSAHRPAQTPSQRAADAAQVSPATAGSLHVEDLAAGHEIKAGETYGVDLPAGKVRVLVAAGEVRLTNKGGASLRPCSNQPFEIDASSSANAAPLITACGQTPALVQAEIPQPALPAPAPPVAISPATLRAAGE